MSNHFFRNKNQQGDSEDFSDEDEDEDEEDDDDDGEEKEEGEKADGEAGEKKEGGEGAPVDPDLPAPLPEFNDIEDLPQAVKREKSEGRLIIKMIELTNFKSYLGTRTIGPFHKSFSAVVGPNGSGKSNTIDALLFVFGKRANKIRLKKVSELIHRSNGHEDIDSAKVSVHFCDIKDINEDEYEEVPNSHFVVSREAFANNTSRYKVDTFVPDEKKGGFKKPKTATWQEVHELLLGKGIDLEHNRFLILQGEVEQISLMKPKAQNNNEDGFLEYLEDIIGSNRFVDHIEHFNKELEKLSDQRNSRLQRKDIAQREVDTLEGPKKEAEMYIRTDKKHLELKSVECSFQLQSIAKTSEVAEKEEKQAKAELDEVLMTLHEAEKSLHEFEAKNKEQTENYKKAEKDQEEAKKAFTEFESKDASLQTTIKNLKVKLERDQRLMEGEQQKIEKSLRAAQELRESIPEKQQTLEKMEEGKKSAEAELERDMVDINKQSEHIGKEKDAKEAKLLPLKAKQAEHHREVTELREEARILSNKQTSAMEQLENMKTEHKAAKEAAKTANTRSHQWNARAQSIKEELKKNDEHIAEWEREIPELQKVRTETKIKFDELRYKANTTANQGKLMNAIMGAAKAKQLTGIHGRLGDCGRIDKKYDIAVCNATNALDNVVVDTAEDGQKCIEFVRQNHLGRVNIIALDKMGKWIEQEKKFKGAPENVKRLYDLIKHDKKYTGAFYYAVRDTLVAKDMEQASRIGLKGKTQAERHRVVTLDGKLIEPSGTLTGGGNAKKEGGGMSGQKAEVVSEDMVNAAKMEYQEMQNAYEQATLAKDTCVEQREALLKEQEDMSWNLKQSAMDAKQAADLLADFDARIKVFVVPELTADEKKRIKAIEKEVDALENKHEKFNNEVTKLEEEVNALHESILNAGAAKKEAHKRNINEWEKKVRTVKDDISKTNVDSEHADAQAAMGEKQVKKAEDLLETTKKNLGEAEAEYATLEDQAMVVVDNFNKAQEVLKELGEFCEKIEAERNETRRKTQEIKRREVEYDGRLKEKMTKTANEMHKWKICRERLAEVRKLHKELPLDLLAEEEPKPEPPKPVLEDEEELDDIQKDENVEITINAIDADIEKEELEKIEPENVRSQIMALKANMDQMRPNVQIISEYREKLKTLEKRNKEFQEVHDARKVILSKLDDLKQRRFNEFMDGFNTIAIKLKEMYQMLTLGGDAELELVDQGDPFAEGIEFSVRPPKKSWKKMTNLSGGEKTLSSLALVFALHHFRPTPLYFMDEIDAALDYRNVSIIANYVKRRTKDAQFIIISLRNHMFELSDRLVGVYKTNDASKSVGIYPYRLERGNLKNVDEILTRFFGCKLYCHYDRFISFIHYFLILKYHSLFARFDFRKKSLKWNPYCETPATR